MHTFIPVWITIGDFLKSRWSVVSYVQIVPVNGMLYLVQISSYFLRFSSDLL
jgi:hypothetical protein